MVIDLGVPRDEIELAPRPLLPRQRRVVALALAFVALMGVAGGAAPVRPELVSVTIRATAADEIVVGDDALYLMRPGRGVVRAGLRTITSYALPEATGPVWEAALYTDGPVRGASLVDGMLLALAEGPEIQTIAIRPGTGREVWRRSGWYNRTAPGHGLLQDFSLSDLQRLFNVDLATGDVRWSKAYPSEHSVVIDEDRFVRWTPAGVVELYDADSGAPLATARLPVDPQQPPVLMGDLLLVHEQADGRPVLAAYGTDRLDRRWQADVDPRSEYVSGECGDALCVGVGDFGGLRLVDLATGRTRWSAPGLGYAYPVGRYLLGYGPGQLNNSQMVLLDPADGHLVADFGQWDLSFPSKDWRMLGVRENGPRALVARLDAAAADVDVLGLLADVSLCRPTPLAVVCRRAGGSVGVWYPRRRL
ncbi:PQQ-binding-like beta-propeller repeat protein [Phytohabitans sp. ZYX-F-186]|uniref:PQQ-binding-like beta-propeller repeat protein n=1 Tax=Phytohabitans maris TaxID=3071409 RepID=A0ABU0ZHJ6_9ACTN|nr:PQQ-binding-like beta-propeller repeat protein [Phytohabitans sp. ZYX-F-186]MDQ7906528.1 PQQ-binding-like beta-propeller repeat protein [Phytohabitans sp. ZYX-F-186]